MSKLSLSVQAVPKAKPVPARGPVLGPADVRDQRWLDERIAHIEDGIEAVLDIARNWSEGMNLSRLHPGVSAQDYILGRVKSPLGRGVVVPLLAESNLSNRQIAAIAGVSDMTVGRTATDVAVERPAETLGADGRLRAVRERGDDGFDAFVESVQTPESRHASQVAQLTVAAQAFALAVDRCDEPPTDEEARLPGITVTAALKRLYRGRKGGLEVVS